MIVHVPGPLRSYTRGASEVEVEGNTLSAILRELDRRFPGMKFRMIDEQDQVRTHIKVFINTRQEIDLGRAVGPTDEISIICALSGG